MKNLITFITILLTIGLSAQNVITVDNNQGAGAQYSELQTAINDANSGDIIYVQPSPNDYGNININKTLSIYGMGHQPELNAGLNAKVGTIEFTNASNTQISGLGINSINLTSNSLSNINSNIIITNNRIGRVLGNNSPQRANNAIINGNYFNNPDFRAIDNNNSQNWVIANNIIEQSNTNSIWTTFEDFNSSTVFSNNIILTRQNGDSNQSIQLFKDCNGTSISNNIFLFTGSNVSNINLGDNIALDYSNNLTNSYNSNLSPLPGTNNLDNTDPLLTSFNPDASLNTTTNNYELQSGSPAEDAGTDGNDLGVFNGNFPFNLRGYPTELPYLTEFTIFNTSISAGETLNINIKANANINN